MANISPNAKDPALLQQQASPHFPLFTAAANVPDTCQIRYKGRRQGIGGASSRSCAARITLFQGCQRKKKPTQTGKHQEEAAAGGAANIPPSTRANKADMIGTLMEVKVAATDF